MSMAKFKALTRLGYGCEPIKHLLIFKESVIVPIMG